MKQNLSMTHRTLAFALALGLAGPAFAQEHREDYFVTFSETGLIHYRGDVAGLPATATHGARVSASSPAVKNYTAYLATQRAAHVAAMERELGRNIAPSHSYAVTRNGIGAALTPSEAARVARLPGVADVRVAGTSHLATYRGPAFIGADAVWSTGVPGSRGEGQVVGVIDTGAAAAHPSFANDASCGLSPALPKLLSARDCATATDGVCDGANPEANPGNGHGVHVASTAAGNTLDATASPAPGLPSPYTRMSGVAPCAQVRSYKVCETNECSNMAMDAALENAILDGVDVINLSISGGQTPWEDFDRSMLEAVGQDIIVVAAAGNTGAVTNPVGQVNHLGPWVTTVAAITHDANTVGSGSVSVVGPGTPPAALQNLVALPSSSPSLGEGLGPRALRTDANNVDGCMAFPAGAFDGAFALIARGNCNFSVKLDNAAAAGAVGALVYNNEGGSITMDVGTATLPGYTLTLEDGGALLAFLAQAPDEPLVELTPAMRRGDVLANFSLRGPVPAFLDANKPDIAAPGVSIYAATVADVGNYQRLDGTSMATPHVAGAMALVRARHPGWSASEVASALVTTASPDGVREDVQTAWNSDDVGAGRARVDRALAAGLTLHETYEHFLAADPADGGDVSSLNIPSMRQLDCTGECTFVRTVTNRLATAGQWEADYVAQAEQIGASIVPRTFRLDPGQSQVLTITYTPKAGTLMPRAAVGAVRLRETNGAAPEQRLRSVVQGVGSFTFLSADANQVQMADSCRANPAQGNGVAEPGERVVLHVPVQANGENFAQVQAQLVPPLPAGVRVLRGTSALGNLALGATAEAQFEIELAAEATCLSSLPLHVQLQGNAHDYALELPVRVGQERPLPADLPRAIPDGNAAGTMSTLDVTEALTAQSLAVRVAIEHPWVGDLRIQLTSPAGTTVTLLDRPGVPASGFGCGNRDVVTRFADGAANAESACATGPGRAWPLSEAAPVQPLAAFAGQPMQGQWTLTVSDATGGYRGRILDWSLEPQPGFALRCAVCEDAAEQIFADGFDTL